MMILITGANGTVGSALGRHLDTLSRTWTGWDRAAFPAGDLDAANTLIAQLRPTALIHTALPSQPSGAPNEDQLIHLTWTGQLASLCARLDIPMVFTSTVMVYTDNQPGPYTPETDPKAAEGYGAVKLRAEGVARAGHPGVRIARLSWQIGDDFHGNQMLAQLAEQAKGGSIAASNAWLPACAHLDDTAAALVRLLELPPGSYLLNSNTQWTYAQIVHALITHHGLNWTVTENSDYVHDQRMLDERVRFSPLEERYPELLTNNGR